MSKARKIPTSTTGRKCSICTHNKVVEINLAISDGGKSFRAVSRQFVGDDSARDSVRRHTENCLNLEIQALIKEKKIGNAIIHHQEISDQLAFAKDLRIAARKYLSDPVTGEVSLDYHATEIDVIYVNLHNVIKNGGNKKEKAKLQDLLDWIATDRPQIEPQSAILKKVDIRSFALDAIKTTDLVLDKIAKIEGLYQKEQENETSAEINALRQMLLKLAEENKTDFQIELDLFLIDARLKPEIKNKLITETVQ